MLWFTSLARPLDLRLPSNRLAAALAVTGLFGGALAAWLGDSSALDAAMAGATLGATIFFAWALARELDPDGTAAAFVAVALAAMSWFVVGSIDLWALLMAVGLARMVARTVGPPAKFGDALLLVSAAGVAALVLGRWPIAVAASLAFVLDASLQGGKRSRLAFALAAAAAAAGSFWWSSTATWQLPAYRMSVAVVIVLVTIGAVSLPEPVAPCDDGRHRLWRSRIQAANMLVLALFVLTALDPAQPAPAVAVGAALVGTTLGRRLPRAKEPASDRTTHDRAVAGARSQHAA